jgi:Tfp pilus assembly pilus retraction ATPase PilT
MVPGQQTGASTDESDVHIMQVQTALKEINPDILLLQEVRDWEAVEKAVSVLPGFNFHIVSTFTEADLTDVC